jgi:hypothetical protein
MRLFCLLFPFALVASLAAQTPCDTRHLTIFDANLAEYLHERTVVLQPGLNTIEWRSLMPQAIVRTLRVTGDQVTVLRQNVSYDGPEARGQKRPVLQLTLRNEGAAGPRKIQVDYLAPGLSWKGDYGLLLLGGAKGAPPREMQLDGWATLQNDTASDICAAAVDLVAGEVQLQYGGGQGRQFTANAQVAFAAAPVPSQGPEIADMSGVSIFDRVRLGSDIAMNASTLLNRFPLVQRLRLGVEQRYIFENDFRDQTLGRGGFMLQPRGLEVRLVGRNTGASPLPAGTVTVYSQESGAPQVVGQDRIPLTPAGADFSVTQGRSNTLQGTRRIVERREIPDQTATRRRSRLLASIEVMLSNRAAAESTAFVREGVEPYGDGDWTVTQSTQPHQKLGARTIEFRVAVPARGEVKIGYTVEIR